MNYNNYNPNFNPYQNYYQQPQQTQFQPQPAFQINQYTYVNGIEGAKSYQVQPGKTVLLVDNDNPLVYFKSANDLGQSSLRYFSINEIDESKAKITTGASQPASATVETVAKSDFEDLIKKVEKLNGKINKLEKTLIPEEGE